MTPEDYDKLPAELFEHIKESCLKNPIIVELQKTRNIKGLNFDQSIAEISEKVVEIVKTCPLDDEKILVLISSLIETKVLNYFLTNLCISTINKLNVIKRANVIQSFDDALTESVPVDDGDPDSTETYPAWVNSIDPKKLH